MVKNVLNGRKIDRKINKYGNKFMTECISKT